MKKLILIALVALLGSCGPLNENRNTNMKAVTTYRADYLGSIDIVIIDSCEYIRSSVYSGAVYTHKGNCNYCAIRNKKP